MLEECKQKSCQDLHAKDEAYATLQNEHKKEIDDLNAIHQQEIAVNALDHETALQKALEKLRFEKDKDISVLRAAFEKDKRALLEVSSWLRQVLN